jgi:hypothetical protein
MLTKIGLALLATTLSVTTLGATASASERGVRVAAPAAYSAHDNGYRGHAERDRIERQRLERQRLERQRAEQARIRREQARRSRWMRRHPHRPYRGW